MGHFETDPIIDAVQKNGELIILIPVQPQVPAGVLDLGYFRANKRLL
jgi:hypothetical protein